MHFRPTDVDLDIQLRKAAFQELCITQPEKVMPQSEQASLVAPNAPSADVDMTAPTVASSVAPNAQVGDIPMKEESSSPAGPATWGATSSWS